MKRPNKGGRRIVPQLGGQSSETGETVGPPIYRMVSPEAKVTLVKPIPLDEWQIGEAGPPMTPEEFKAYCAREGILDPDRPLIPTAEEFAKLPGSARTAFTKRCAARIAPLAGSVVPSEVDPQSTASFLLAAATVKTPLTRLLRCIRRDFDKVYYLARKNNWTDDTLISQEVFGPMWPKGLIPPWAEEAKEPPKTQPEIT
jgi:hypothetical protein